jgi:osmotically inducible protein OsmC
MPTRNASAEWKGETKRGGGTVALGSGAFEGQYNFSGRFADGSGTNPEELLGAAHASCFAMALSLVLSNNGTPPDSLDASAKVTIDSVDDGFEITRIELTVRGRVPGIDADGFQQAAQGAKEGCPVSKALGAVKEITLDATLEE